MKNSKKIVFLFIVSLVLFCGCSKQSKYMRVCEDKGDMTNLSDKALVVFMRPATMGFAIQSSVFDISEDKSDFVGIVSAKTKVAYETTPGEKTFMVVGESADFMKADLKAGKTYYALVTPRMGAWKARFSLKPVTKEELLSDNFKKWSDVCKWAEKTDSADKWAVDNNASIERKKEKYLTKWMAREDKPCLKSEDTM